MTDEIRIRDADEGDAAAITELFRIVYGSGYVHAEFYDVREIKRMIFDEDALVLVAEAAPSGPVVGTASVLFRMGAYSDLVGEFGRLVVHPDWRRRGIGHRLMEERLARVGDRLQVAFVEVRVPVPASPRISLRHGFVPVGLLPQKLLFGEQREHAGLLVRYFRDALGLRKNHPRIIPEAQYLADFALSGVGLTPDVVVDESAAPYPRGGGHEIEELTEEGYSSLLRIERGRLRNREIFGPQRLHYGLFKLSASHAHYLVAREGQRIVGALGYMRDDLERHMRVFEVIHTEETAIHALFCALSERCEAEGMMAAEVDVSAHGPRMQRTLLELGYLPCAYVPAMAFHEVERVDVVKMYRLFQPLMELPFDAPEPALSVGRRVLGHFAARDVLPRLARAMEELAVCDGLSEEQSRRLLGAFRSGTFERGATLFEQGAPASTMLLVLQGSAEVLVDGTPVGRVDGGEALGEVALLTETPHSATAVAQTEMEVGILEREELEALVRRRPDIGVVVYRNLARGLGEKLRRADRVGGDAARDA